MASQLPMLEAFKPCCAVPDLVLLKDQRQLTSTISLESFEGSRDQMINN